VDIFSAHADEAQAASDNLGIPGGNPTVRDEPEIAKNGSGAPYRETQEPTPEAAPRSHNSAYRTAYDAAHNAPGVHREVSPELTANDARLITNRHHPLAVAGKRPVGLSITHI
jgi:hypothetical protein